MKKSKQQSKKRNGYGAGKREYVYSPAYQSWASQFRPMKASQRRAGN